MTLAALFSALAAVAISFEMTVTAAVLGAAALFIAGYGG
ncbi:hypothetical protein ABID58_005435 [Bradyrhizobium sp. S3.2.6]